MSAEAWQAAIAHLIEERVGLRLRLSEPWDTLVPFVQGRIQALDLSSAASYVRYLRSEPYNGVEFVRLVAVCTNGQTSFFRDHEQLRGLCETAVSIARAHRRPLNVWSAGCSTGQEPYTLAMLFTEAKVQASILATDINTDVLQTTRQGAYSAWALRNVPDDVRTRHFEPVADQFVVRENLRLMVTTRQHNLLGEPPQPLTASKWDIILCRNVFIYHSEETVARIINNMAGVLADDGWLFIGASESLHRMEVPFTAAEVGSRHAYRLIRRGDDCNALLPKADLPATLESEATSQPRPEPDGDQPPSNEPTVENIRAFLAKNPRHAIGWLLLGHVYVNVHAFNEALEAYQHAQENAPLLVEAHYFQGVVHRKVGDLSQAEQTLRRALFLAPHFWPASFLLAGIYERQDRLSLQRKELIYTLQTLGTDHVRVAWSVSLDGFKSLHLDADSVRRTCENLLRNRS